MFIDIPAATGRGLAPSNAAAATTEAAAPPQFTGPIYLAVDAENIFLSLRETGKRPNYRALLNYVNGFGQKTWSAIYTPRHEGAENEIGFLLALKHIGFNRVVYEEPWGQPDGRHKSALDTRIALDVQKAALTFKLGGVVLVSGDSDFVPLLEDLLALHIPTLVIGPQDKTAKKLVVAATWFRFVNDIAGFGQ